MAASFEADLIVIGGGAAGLAAAAEAARLGRKAVIVEGRPGGWNDFMVGRDAHCNEYTAPDSCRH